MMLEKVFWTWRVSASSSGDSLDDVRLLVDARDQVGLGRREVVDPDPLPAVDQDPKRAVGHLQHARDDADDADAVDVVRARALDLGVLARDHHEHAVPRRARR